MVIRYLALASALLLAPLAAADAGDWLLRVGAHYAAPKSDNHDIVEVEDATMVTFDASYFVTPNWAVELLAALPYKHDIKLVGGGQVGETKHLPPTLSVQYHFAPDARFRPYVGAGVNVTIFFEEDTTGVLAGSKLELDTSVGAALQTGFDVDLTDRVFLNVDVRYVDMETKAKLNGVSLGNVEIDPWLFGLSLGMRL